MGSLFPQNQACWLVSQGGSGEQQKHLAFPAATNEEIATESPSTTFPLFLKGGKKTGLRSPTHFLPPFLQKDDQSILYFTLLFCYLYTSLLLFCLTKFEI